MTIRSAAPARMRGSERGGLTTATVASQPQPAQMVAPSPRATPHFGQVSRTVIAHSLPEKRGKAEAESGWSPSGAGTGTGAGTNPGAGADPAPSCGLRRDESGSGRGIMGATMIEAAT